MSKRSVTSDHREIQIFIKYSPSFTVEVLPNDTIYKLKKQIQDKLNIHPVWQRLILNSKELDKDTEPLSTHHPELISGTSITLLIKRKCKHPQECQHLSCVEYSLTQKIISQDLEDIRGEVLLKMLFVEGKTPRKCLPDFMRTLVNADGTIDVNGRDWIEGGSLEGSSCLHLASMWGWFQVVEALLDVGANVNQENRSSGDTPLHLAINFKNFAVASLLVKHGADWNYLNFEGKPPFCGYRATAVDPPGFLRTPPGVYGTMTNMLHQSYFSDATLTCADGRSLRCHKAVLCAVSEYFKAMFLGNFDGTSPPLTCDSATNGDVEIVLNGVKFEIMEIFLRYLYGDFRVLPGDDLDVLSALYELADRFLLTDLKEHALFLIMKNISPKNIVEVWQRYPLPLMANETFMTFLIGFVFAHVGKFSTENGKMRHVLQEVLVGWCLMCFREGRNDVKRGRREETRD